jgi:hypothetical protein
MMNGKLKTWSCKIGEIDPGILPQGSDGPMRKAVHDAYFKLTGIEPNFIFSGWGAELDDLERSIVYDVEDDRRYPDKYNSGE